MTQTKKKKEFLPQPIYPGGPKAMGRFIQECLKYPKEALEQNIEGTVMVRIEINYQGRVIHAKSVNHLGGGCEQEAERVASLLRFEVPKIHKLKVRYFKKINVRFKLPSTQGKNLLLNYQVIPDQKETIENSGNSYQYTIRIN